MADDSQTGKANPQVPGLTRSPYVFPFKIGTADAWTITAAFLSHSHSDHLNGFVRDNRPAFPNAACYYLPRGACLLEKR